MIKKDIKRNIMYPRLKSGILIVRMNHIVGITTFDDQRLTDSGELSLSPDRQIVNRLKGGNMNRQTQLKRSILTLISILILSLLTLSFSSCCKECPVGPGDPQPYRGWLYATGTGDDYIYRIDTETDSLVDSVKCEISDDYYPGRPVVSKDGRYLAIAFLDNLNETYFMRVYNAQTMTVITDINEPVYPHGFIIKDNLLVTVASKRLVYYSLPDFTVTGEDSLLNNIDSITCSIQKIDDSKGLFYLWITSRLSDGRDSLWMAAYDYKKREIVDDWSLDIHIGGAETFIFNNVKIYDNPLRMYFLGYSELGNGIFGCYDFESESELFTRQFEMHWGGFDLSPDGCEVYVTDPGGFMDVRTSGTVFVLDAMTGAYLHGISLYGYDPIPDRPLFANTVIFTPSGEKAYVGSGRNEKGSGTISVINTSTRDITNHIWPELGHYIDRFVIGPKY